MKRLTSDNPSFDLNTIYGKDHEAWAMGGGRLLTMRTASSKI